MNLAKSLRALVAAGVGLGLGTAAACYIQPAQQPQYQQPPPAPAAGTAPAQTKPGAPATNAQLRDGWYYCHFRQQNQDYKRYYCRVSRAGRMQRITKAGGFEKFVGNIVTSSAGAQMTGRSSCNKMGTNCRRTFQVRLQQVGQVFRGQVRGPSGWWLNNGTLTLQFVSTHAPRGAYGGPGYGGARYGGTSYGGARYGGARYGGHSYGGRF